jgi:hypothetical protein
MNSNNDQIFINRFNQHPELRERMESLLNVVENAAGDCTKADDAEQHVIEELRKMGNEALHSWANKAALKSAEALCNQEVKLYRNGKKSLLAHNLRENLNFRTFILSSRTTISPLYDISRNHPALLLNAVTTRDD